MKHLVILFSVFAQLFSFALFSQSTKDENFEHIEPLESFILFQNNDQIDVIFTLSAGYTCIGMTLQRSSNGVNFKDVKTIFGVCGSLEFPSRYQITDDNPIKNQENHYRILLGHNDISEVKSLPFIGHGDKKYLLRDYGNQKEIVLKEFHRNLNLTIISIDGSMIESREVNSKNILLNSSNYHRGIYLIVIRDESHNTIFSEKIYFH
jgi:hypothetical protein